MKERFNTLFSDKLVKYSVYSSLAFFVIDIIFVLLFYRNFPPYIPFFNSMPWGAERLAPSGTILVLFGVFLLIIIFNNFLGLLLYEKYPLIARLMSFASLLFVFLGFLASLQIILLVF